MFAAVHRRFPGDGTPDWRTGQAVDPVAALAASTRGPALGAGCLDEGHLRPGARADLAVLNVGRATLLTAEERLADTRSLLTLVGGRIVHGG
jgi:predicted amidohydrolase YtcJ